MEWTVPFLIKRQARRSKHPKGFFVSLTTFAGIMKWLAGLIKFTEEEREDAGIYLDRPRGE